MKTRQTLTLFLLTVLLLTTHGGTAPAAISPAGDLKDILENYDHQFLSSFRLELDATLPTHMDTVHGHSQAIIIATSAPHGQHLDLVRSTIDPIQYLKTGSFIGAPSSGTMVLNYDKHLAISLEDQDWRIRRDPESIAVDASSKPTRPAKMIAPRLDIYPKGHQDAANLFYRYILPLGRGYAQLLDRVTDASTDPNGIITVQAEGTLFSPYRGTWNLEVDTRAAYLVRKATFTRQGAPNPGLICEASHLHEGAIPIYEEGSLRLSTNYLIQVKLKQYSSTPTDALSLRAKVKDTISSETLPESSTIMDFRSIDSDHIPRIMRAKPVSVVP